MTDIADFLRARYTEDRARVGQWHDLECDIHEHLGGDLAGAIAAAEMLSAVPGAVCSCGGPESVLADLDAKERIVNDFAEASRCWDPDPETWYEVADGCAAALHRALRLLAVPFAAHPDYDARWRP
ncbi:DUF6221 family protein [Streptomyces sp. NBC_01476]|uniref:DUF6221 family protein n=1 Tax=Streptomyces sp. NBC_01476 TaxID=2903881 RepID=UPI002E32D9EE|nr:DUF6221 family protein [Streptomyces sp. NBC_01476]